MIITVNCKLLEHIIYCNAMSHINQHEILSLVQFGFRGKYSAELQLLRTLHDFALNLNCNGTTDACFLIFVQLLRWC